MSICRSSVRSRVGGASPRGGLLSAAVATMALGCSSSAPPPATVGPAPTTDSGADATVAGFTVRPLGCGSAGTQSVVAVSGSKIGFASLAATTATQTCTISPLGPVLTSKVPMWNVCYAESDSGGAFSSKVVTSQPYVDPTGVGLAFDSGGNPAVAFTGVGTGAPSEKWCGANNLFLATSQGGTFGTPVQVSNGSASGGLVASQAGSCSQGICDKGDTTGLWPALGFDSSDKAWVAFRDIHFGFAADDFAKSDVELAEGSGGSYSILTIDVSRGGGSYNQLAFTPAGLPAVLQYNATGGMPGVYLDRDTTSGGISAQEADGGWPSEIVSSGAIGAPGGFGGGLGFAISAKGVFGVAYYDQVSSRLFYVESTDGVKWSSPATVDLSGSTGFSPSLAFDAAGDPAIAYYRCNGKGPSVTTCDPATDGLYLARRSGTTWSPAVVHADPSVTDGLYPALAFVSGKAMIAYQVTSFDPISKTSSSTWWVAEQP